MDVTETRRPVVLSCGGGLDSFAMLVQSIRVGQKPDVVVFVDVGDPDHDGPGEWPATYQHLREVVQPLCEREGIDFHWLSGDWYPVRDARSLFYWLSARHQIPVAGPDRICTIVAKVERFERWLDDHYPDTDVEVWVGFEAGEEARAAKDPNAGGRRKVKPGQARRHNRFPLMEAGLCRCRCAALVQDAGFAVPHGSACTFCPYATKGDWQKLERELPETFAEIEQLEADKPPTERNGIKLSIMGFRTLYKVVDGQRVKVGNRAPMLRQFIEGTYRPRARPCAVCGAPARFEKTMGCGSSVEEPVRAAG